MSPRQALFSIAALLLLAGLVFAVQPRSVEGGYEGKTECGSVLSPDPDAGNVTDSIAGSDLGGECDDKLGGMKPFMFGAFGLAGIAFIAAFVASPQRSGRNTT